MRVLVLTSTYPRWKDDTEPGFVHELNKRLAETEEITTIAPGYPGAAKEEVMDGVKVIRYNYFFNKLQKLCYDGGILPNIKAKKWKILLVPFLLTFMAIAIVKAQRKYQFDLVHCHWIIPQGVIFALTAKLFRIKTPAIVTSHGGDLFSLKNKLLQTIKIKSLVRFNRLLVVSKAMKNKAIELGVESQKILVQPMGVDLTNTFTPPPAGTIRQGIIFVGRLVEKKGIKYLLQAISIVAQTQHHVKLTIIGGGPQMESLKNLTQQLQIEKIVVFTGPLDNKEIPAYLQTAKISVIPSIVTTSGDQEGLGLTVVESLGCGCQVIASEIPAIRSEFNNIPHLYFCPSKNPEELAKRIMELLKADQISSNESFNYIQHFDWSKTKNSYRKIYSMHLKHPTNLKHV